MGVSASLDGFDPMEALDGSSDEENEGLKSSMEPFLLNLTQNTRFEVSKTESKVTTYLSPDLSIHFGDADFYLAPNFKTIISDFKNSLEVYTSKNDPVVDIFVRQKEKKE